MKDDRWVRFGAAAGAAAVALFLAGSLVVGQPVDFDASGTEVAARLEDERARIQIGSAILAASGPFLVWFLATVAWLARAAGSTAARAGMVALGCGLVFLALFFADVTSLAVSALRPESMAADPELASALRDFEFLAMGIAAPLVSAMLVAFAVLAIRDGALWPRGVGWLAAVAAVAYAARVGTLFTTEGVFAADGLLGLYVPVIAVAGWIVIASMALALRIRTASEPSELFGSASGSDRRPASADAEIVPQRLPDDR